MKSFRINVFISGGDKVNCNVAAENQAAALSRLKSNEQFLQFVGNREIEKIEISAAAEYVAANPGDYVLQKSETIAGGWVVTDKKNNLVLTFAEGRYNETAKLTFLFKTPAAALDSAAMIRKIGEFLAVCHPEIKL